MIQNIHPIYQAFLGTLFTWGLTALGAGLVVVINESKRKILDASLGFAAGVMIAASYWSLLEPAIEMSEQLGYGKFSFVPAAIGFAIGALFVYLVDVAISSYGLHSPAMLLAYHGCCKKNKDAVFYKSDRLTYKDTISIEGFGKEVINPSRKRKVSTNEDELSRWDVHRDKSEIIEQQQWKRILLLIIAITVHNIPEGLAVGVAFAAVGVSPSATFQSARNLAIGIGIQNFPEGLAVSLPLKAAGFSTWKSFWYGQLSGMVEPIFGLLGAAAITLATPLLPYALAFAAGAMIYVVIDDVIPEANSSGNGKLASWGTILGFLVMMALDVGLG